MMTAVLVVDETLNVNVDFDFDCPKTIDNRPNDRCDDRKERLYLPSRRCDHHDR